MKLLPLFGATLALLCSTSAAADVLIDNVKGVRIDEDGDVDRFTGLWVDDDGTILEVLDKGDKRPEHPKYLSDMDGQIIVPGMIDAHLHVMGIGFGALTAILLDISMWRNFNRQVGTPDAVEAS